MSFAVIGTIGILVCWKWGDWRNWRKYYPTILYLLIGDFVTDFLFYNFPLWSFGPLVESYPILDICVMLLLYPGAVILYLTYYPKSVGKQVLYILMWALIFVICEYIASVTDGFTYHNGWNIWYSVLFDLTMFPLLRLHYKKSLLVWPISTVLTFIVIFWFRVPLMR